MAGSGLNRVEQLLAIAQSRTGRLVALTAYLVMSAVLAYGWVFQDYRDGFLLIMGAMFLGWAVEVAIQLAFPRGSHAGAIVFTIVLVVVSCAYLFGRDGHWGYAVMTLLGCACALGAVVMTAMWGSGPADGADQR
jgi:peptidoglycan/LPS O-acetylase OafA/YrhL